MHVLRRNLQYLLFQFFPVSVLCSGFKFTHKMHGALEVNRKNTTTVKKKSGLEVDRSKLI